MNTERVDGPLSTNPNVVFADLGISQAALLHLETKRYYSLNETGRRIWQLLGEGTSERTQIVEALEVEYESTPAELEGEVDAFLTHMLREDLVRQTLPS